MSILRRPNIVCNSIKLVASCIVITSLAIFAQAQDAKTGLPNIVVFLSDDQGWGDFSCNGNTNLSTPNIDSLAKDGVLFENFYVCPVCSPTRAEFLTGRYHTRGNVFGVSRGNERLSLEEKTIADALKKAGYATGCFGKWHNGMQYPYHPMWSRFRRILRVLFWPLGRLLQSRPLEHNGSDSTKVKGYMHR